MWSCHDKEGEVFGAVVPTYPRLRGVVLDGTGDLVDPIRRCDHRRLQADPVACPHPDQKRCYEVTDIGRIRLVGGHSHRPRRRMVGPSLEP